MSVEIQALASVSTCLAAGLLVCVIVPGVYGDQTQVLGLGPALEQPGHLSGTPSIITKLL